MMRAPHNAFAAPLWAGCRVGLLGGSFNPAHAGHVAISLEALKALQLHAVWWLVTPQNPLKDMAALPLAGRAQAARALVAHPRIVVTTLEQPLGTRYTADTLAALRQRFPRTEFLWLMGADNLVQISRWQRWTEIFRTLPVVVFRRAPHQTQHATAKAARRFVHFRRAARAGRALGHKEAGTTLRRRPEWLVMVSTYHPESSTAIRAAQAAPDSA